MQKKLLTKTLIIVGVLLVFVFGIFGIPKSLSGDGLKGLFFPTSIWGWISKAAPT